MPASISSPIQPSWYQYLLPFDLPVLAPSPAPEPTPAPSKPSTASPREFGFGILSAICQVELVDRVLAECDRMEERCRLLPARLMVYAVLLMCLSQVSYDKLMHGPYWVSWRLHFLQVSGGIRSPWQRNQRHTGSTRLS